MRAHIKLLKEPASVYGSCPMSKAARIDDMHLRAFHDLRNTIRILQDPAAPLSDDHFLQGGFDSAILEASQQSTQHMHIAVYMST